MNPMNIVRTESTLPKNRSDPRAKVMRFPCRSVTAALIAKDQGSDVIIIGKGEVYGGSTAMSGGAIWIPSNHLMNKAGLKDSPEEALTYLKNITRGKVSEDRLHAYIETGPNMVKYLEKQSHVHYHNKDRQRRIG